MYNSSSSPDYEYDLFYTYLWLKRRRNVYNGGFFTDNYGLTLSYNYAGYLALGNTCAYCWPSKHKASIAARWYSASQALLASPYLQPYCCLASKNIHQNGATPRR
jgi:hypothetical protein